MKEFFHGSRRKAGVATLVMACVFCGLCIRGQFYIDRFTLHGNSSGIEFYTGFMGIGIWHSKTAASPKQTFSWQTSPRPTLPLGVSDEYIAAKLGPQGYWKWERCGFGMWKRQQEVNIWMSHWLCIAPLTLFSAYLILWKPRKRGLRPN